MAQELTLRINQTPSMWNKETAIGGLLGSMMAPLIGTIAGMLVGGFIGKMRMEKEAVLGKKVSSETSFWNKDALLGGLVGLALGSVATFVAAATGVALTVAGGGIVGLPLIGVALLGGTAISAVAGTYFGGKHGQKRQAQEYADAVQQQAVMNSGRSPSPEFSQEPANDYTRRIAQERERAAQQGRAV